MFNFKSWEEPVLYAKYVLDPGYACVVEKYVKDGEDYTSYLSDIYEIGVDSYTIPTDDDVKFVYGFSDYNLVSVVDENGNAITSINLESGKVYTIIIHTVHAE